MWQLSESENASLLSTWSSHIYDKEVRQAKTVYPAMSVELRGTILSKINQLDAGCWISKAKQIRLRGVRYQLKPIIFKALLGYSPEGYLFPVCSTKGCVSPFHQRDGHDREEAAMKHLNYNPDREELESKGFDPDYFQITTRGNAGMTREFSCYGCNREFDPVKSINDVLCDYCYEPGINKSRHTTAFDGPPLVKALKSSN